MEPLDLRTAPPRAPRETLAGVVFMPRSIDKIRAVLPGGELGEFTIDGFTETMLEHIGVTLADLTKTVADAANEADVAAFITAHAAPAGVEAWNTYALNRLIFNGDRAAAIEEIPWLADRPDIIYSLDLIHEDDKRSFSASR